jgi:hypothetical protein
MDFRSFWIATAAIYLGSIAAVPYAGWRRMDRLPRETGALLAGLSTAGLLQHLYFLVYGIDFHLSLICTPLLMMITLWVSAAQNERTAAGIPGVNRWIFGMAVLIGLLLYAVQACTWLSAGLRNFLAYEVPALPAPGGDMVLRDPYRCQPYNARVSAFVDLLETCAAGRRSVAVFARPGDQVEALLLTGKTHVLGLSDPAMCSFSRSFVAHVLDSAAREAGTPGHIFFDSTCGALLDVQRNAFGIPASAGRYSVVERMADILVYRREETP